MRPATQMSPIEYFASLSFGQRVGMAKDLTFRHGLVVLGLVICIMLAVMFFLWAMLALMGVEGFNSKGSLRTSTPSMGFGMSLLLVFLLMMAMSVASWFVGIGMCTLGLGYTNRSRISVFEALLAPVSNQLGGVLLNFLLWGIIGLGVEIFMGFLANIPVVGIPIQAVLTFIYYQVPLVASFYIADCLIRGRSFKAGETVSKPSLLFFNHFQLWLGSVLFLYFVLSLPAYILGGFSVYQMLNSHLGTAAILLGLSLICWALITPFGLFLLAVTYKQAKARLLLTYQRQASRRP